MSPGPVHVPPALREGIPPLHHRSEEFRTVVRETESMLRELLGTVSPVYLLTSSGTGAMEASIANVTDEGSRVLVISGGGFGDRWAEICRVFRCETDCLRVPDGEAIDVEAVRARIDRSRPQFLALTHVESSTGLLAPLRELAAAPRGERPIIIVDAVSSLGVEDLEMDAWGIDVVVGACQKAFAAPPGVSFVAMGERARALMEKRHAKLYYFDLNRYEEGRAMGDAPFTPATETIQVVRSSLSKMRELGFATVKERHRRTSASFLEAVGHLSLRSFSESPSSAVQVLRLPNGCDAKALLDDLAGEGFIAAGGRGALKGEVVRTGFLGLFGARTLRDFAAALGRGLERCGGAVDLQSALSVIQALPFSDDLFRK